MQKDKNNIITEIEFEKTLHKGTFLLVEGSKDYKFFKMFIDKNQCKPIICDGKENLDVIISETYPNSKSILGIRDLDYARIMNSLLSCNNIFYTDYHDLEILIYSSDTFNNIIDNFGSQEKIANFSRTNNISVFQYLLQNASTIGFFRLISEQNNLNINFENINFEKFIDKNTVKVDIERLVEHLININRSRITLQKEKLLHLLSEAKLKNYNLLEICNGHDFTVLFNYSLRKLIGTINSTNLPIDIFEANIRIAYDSKFLKKTKLYQETRNWEIANSPAKIWDI